MVEAGLLAARRDGEIHAWIIEHPFCVVGLHHRRLGRKKGGVETDRLREIIDGDVHVHALHGRSSGVPANEMERFRGSQAAGATPDARSLSSRWRANALASHPPGARRAAVRAGGAA